jgi:hypothetical protein
MIPQAKEIEALATKYSKPQLQQMAQMGQIDPATAVMAGMMIDRIVQSNIQPPQSTVAQDVMGAAAPQGMAQLPAGGMAPPPMDPSMAAQMPAAGLEALPVPDTMFNEDSFAGGGIVAFSKGDAVKDEYEGFFPFLGRALEDNELARLLRLAGKGAADSEVARYAKPLLFGGTFEETTPEFARSALGPGTLPQSQADYPDESRRGSAAGMTANTAGKSARDLGIGASPASLAGADSASTKGSVSAGSKAPATPATPAKSPYDLFQERLKAAGLSGDLEAEDRAANAAALQELAKERERAKYMAMVLGGVTTLAGTSPDAAKNIAEGLKAGVADYDKSAREIKADEREIKKINRDLRKAAEARKRGDIEKALELEQGARDFELRQKVADAQIRSSNKPSMFEEFRRNPKEFAAFRAAYGGDDGTQALNRLRYADATLANDTTYMSLARSNKPEDKQKAEQIRRDTYARYGVTSGGGGAGGKTLSWNDIK